MGLPIYQMNVYQKTPPKVKHTDITQKSPNCFQQLENIKSLQNNPIKSRKNIKTLEQTPAVLKSRSSNLPRWKCTKRPHPNLNIPASLKNPQFGPGNWKTSKVCKKSQQNLKKILKHLNKPCSIEKWVFQSRRLKRTKRPRPK